MNYIISIIKTLIQNKKYFFISIFLLISIAQPIFSNSEDINSYEYLQVEIQNTISYGITSKKNPTIESLTLKSFFFPTTYNGSQALNSFESTLPYSLKETQSSSYLEYDIKKNAKEKNTIENIFIVQSTIDKPQITQKIIFPQLNLKEEYKTFIEFSGLIDSNEVIKNQASLLAQGEDDTYIIASKIAKWIQEDITYDLSTISANPNQKSTDVFTSKIGVCKEITHLYISMMRSLGIPARVVTGYAYTNSEEVIELVGSNWGGHAWAEVLIGDIWTPFDLTYNQYGYVDASHIVLDKSKEIRLQSASIGGRGYDFEITKNTLSNTNSFEVLEKKQRIIDPGFSITIEGPQELAPESFGHIKVSIENTQNYYQNIFLNIAKVEEIELLDLSEQMVILKPNEKKELIFRYKIPELEKGFIYTFPFKIYNQFFEEEYIINVQNGNQQLEEIELPEITVSPKVYSQNAIEMSCSGIVAYPQNKLICTLKNPNNYEMYNVEICSEIFCQKTNFKVNEKRSVELTTSNLDSEIKLKYNDIIEEYLISIPKPSFSSVNISIDKKDVFIEYSIENNYESLNSKITIINSSIHEKSISKVVFKKYTLSPGEYEVNIEILNGEQVLDYYLDNIIIKELTFFEKVVEFINKIYTSLF